jgi:hypothetical protein
MRLPSELTIPIRELPASVPDPHRLRRRDDDSAIAAAEVVEKVGLLPVCDLEPLVDPPLVAARSASDVAAPLRKAYR